ncbi:MAG: hypothetical protein WCE48_04040 [Steroidobacteraceae bacterium]
MQRLWVFVRDRGNARGGGAVFAAVAITASVPGLVVGAQLLAALIVTPAELGTIRWIESVLAILLLLASCGMPAVAFREAALHKERSALGRLLVRTSAPAIVASLCIVVIGVVSMAWTTFTLARELFQLLVIALGLLIPASVARTEIAVIQGAGLARRYWLGVLGLAIAGILVLTASTRELGVQGWIAGRYVCEIALAVILGRTIVGAGTRSTVSDGAVRLSPKNLLRAGFAANLALVLRALCDNIPILLLRRQETPADEIGFFGLATLLMFAPALLMSGFVQVNVPKLVVVHEDRLGFRGTLHKTIRSLILSASAGLVVLWVISLWLKAHALSGYSRAWIAIILLSGSLPFRAIILASGCALVARARYASSSWATVLEFALVLSAVALLHPDTASGMAVIVLIASAGAALLSSVILRRQARF